MKTIQNELQYLCSIYHISYGDVVKIGRTSELMSLVLYKGFLKDEADFLGSLPLMSMSGVLNLRMKLSGS